MAFSVGRLCFDSKIYVTKLFSVKITVVKPFVVYIVPVPVIVDDLPTF